jgi:hypothetical protein
LEYQNNVHMNRKIINQRKMTICQGDDDNNDTDATDDMDVDIDDDRIQGQML